MLLILEDEKRQRRNAAAKRLLTRAKFWHQADLKDRDETSDRGIASANLRELTMLGFSHRCENLLIYGKTAAGKI